MLQTLFICTGCDYVSYFADFGKSTFLKVFFQHASFINSLSQGTLASTCDTSRESGFLSFVRLIGTVYFKKHLSSFKYDCPRALFNSFSSSDPISQHKQWLAALGPLYGRTLNLRMSFLPHGRLCGGTGSVLVGCPIFGNKPAAILTTS